MLSKNKLKKYNEFINEGLFSSKYKNIIDKIYNYIDNIDIDDVIPEQNSYSIIIRSGGINMERDPFGEEVLEDDLQIRITRSYDYDSFPLYYLDMDGESVKANKWEIRKLYKLIEKKKELKNISRKEEKLNRSFNKF